MFRYFHIFSSNRECPPLYREREGGDDKLINARKKCIAVACGFAGDPVTAFALTLKTMNCHLLV